MTSRGSSSGHEESPNEGVVARPAGLQERLELAVVLAQVQLVVGVEVLDALDERVLLGPGRDRHRVGLDLGVGEELAAEGLDEDGEGPRRREGPLAPGRGRVDGGVRPVEREPSATGFDPPAQRLLRGLARADVARVGHEEVGRGDRVEVLVVLGHLDPDPLVLGHQLEELETGEVEVVPGASTDEVGVDAATPSCHVPSSLLTRDRRAARPWRAHLPAAVPARAPHRPRRCWPSPRRPAPASPARRCPSPPPIRTTPASRGR